MGSLFTSSYRYNPQGLNYGAGAMQAQAEQQQNIAQQQALAQQLAAQAMGVGPSAAQEQLKQATNRGIKQSTAMLASQKGINPALAQRLAAENAAQSTQEMAGQGAQLRAQEAMAARGAQAGLLGQMGQQNLTAQGQYLSGINSQNQINAGIEAQNAANIAGLAGGVINAAGSAMGMGLRSSGGQSSMGFNPQSLPAANYQPSGVMTASKGGHIPGKAKVEGDSEENDTVPAMLSPGEIVVPRSHAKDPEKAKQFIDHLMGHKGEKEDEHEVSYGKILEEHRKLQEKIKSLEAKLKKK
jgi:hypothetical protein